MYKSYIHVIVVSAGVVALSGCGGGGGGGAEALPTTDNTLLSTVPTGSTARMEDYFIPGTGTWRVNLDGQAQTTMFGSAPLVDAMIYDADTDQWTINVAGRNLVLDGPGFYTSASCFTPSGNCAIFTPYDDNPLTSQYGTFGEILYLGATDIVEYFVHAGLKTQSGDMPTGGTGTYAGTFKGSVNYTDPGSSATVGTLIFGDANIVAAFAPDGGNVAFSSTDNVDPALATYSLSGTAVISGNTYGNGTVTGSYDNGAGVVLTLAPDGAGSSLSGAFYGPAADETAGVIYGTSASGAAVSGEVAGGFWAAQTGYTP